MILRGNNFFSSSVQGFTPAIQDNCKKTDVTYKLNESVLWDVIKSNLDLIQGALTLLYLDTSIGTGRCFTISHLNTDRIPPGLEVRGITAGQKRAILKLHMRESVWRPDSIATAGGAGAGVRRGKGYLVYQVCIL